MSHIIPLFTHNCPPHMLAKCPFSSRLETQHHLTDPAGGKRLCPSHRMTWNVAAIVLMGAEDGRQWSEPAFRGYTVHSPREFTRPAGVVGVAGSDPTLGASQVGPCS